MLIYQSSSNVCLNTAAPTEIYTLSLHDALPILSAITAAEGTSIMIPIFSSWLYGTFSASSSSPTRRRSRSEEHTSELQSLAYLVCRLLLEKKKLKYRRSCGSHCEECGERDALRQ